MSTLALLTALACVIIMASTLWACLSHNVFDGIILKVCLGLATLAAYVQLTQPSERALNVLIISIAGICVAATFQRYIMRRRLFHRPGEKVGQRHARSA